MADRVDGEDPACLGGGGGDQRASRGDGGVVDEDGGHAAEVVLDGGPSLRELAGRGDVDVVVVDPLSFDGFEAVVVVAYSRRSRRRGGRRGSGIEHDDGNAAQGEDFGDAPAQTAASPRYEDDFLRPVDAARGAMSESLV